jgi:tetratricopeptide (TPR) repeat protein
MSKQSRAKAATKAASDAAMPRSPPWISDRRSSWLAGGVVVLSVVAAYHDTFSVPFILDDHQMFAHNPTIRHLGSALLPPPSSTAGGRPVFNLTFACNYALGGMNVWGYHAVNLLIHTLAALVLFGLVRRTLLRPAFAGLRRAGPPAPNPQAGQSFADAAWLAMAVAVLWALHPLQTEAVTYISQRAESLMGLFYLLTLYCFVRGAENQRTESSGQKADTRVQIQENEIQKPSDFCPLLSVLWLLASVCSCLLGALTKEVIVTAPVMVLLYDRTFVAGSFREAWRRRRGYYLGLACTWLLVGCLLTGLGQRGAGFDQGISSWNYALTSCRTVVLYCKLAFWPHPLVFDYGTRIVTNAAEIAPYASVLALLLAGVAFALGSRPVIGFGGAWFFVILAPTSSVVPLAFQPMAEHRLYLSLASVITGGVLVLYGFLGRRSFPVFFVMAAGLGWLTVQRNRDYRSELSIWNDTVAKCPDNARAHSNLGTILLEAPRRLSAAVAQFETALKIDPKYAEAHNNLGDAFSMMPGRLPEAIVEDEIALRLQPNYATAHYNLGNALAQSGRLSEAITQYETALLLNPGSVETYNNLGNAMLKLPGRQAEAVAQYRAALRIDPDSAETHNNLGNAMLEMPGQRSGAIAEYEAALRIAPDYAEAHNNLGRALINLPGRWSEAVGEFETALRLNPDYAEAHYNLGNAWIDSPGRLPDAIVEYQEALRINPALVAAHANLGTALLKVPGRLPEAIAQYEAALRIDPDSVEAHFDLGEALLGVPGRLSDAIVQYQEALRLKPDLAPARERLDQLRNQSGPEGVSPTDSALRPNDLH